MAKTYSNKQNARRAARKALNNDQAVEGPDFTIAGTEGAWEVIPPGPLLSAANYRATLPKGDLVDGNGDLVESAADREAGEDDGHSNSEQQAVDAAIAGEAARKRANANAGKPDNPRIGEISIDDPRLAEHPTAKANAASWPVGRSRKAAAKATAPAATISAEPAGGITSMLLGAPWPVTTETEIDLGGGATMLIHANGINLRLSHARGLVPGVVGLGPDQAARLAATLAVAMKPAKARKERAPRAAGGENKRDICKALLLKPEGTTAADLLAATGWPTISVPATAAASGLALRKVKAGKVTRYFGFASEAEADAAADRLASQGEGN